MFDIGFPELVIVAVVALLIIGPDKLPETVRTLALWVGRFKRSMAGLRAEIEQEIGADDIRRQLHNEAIMKELEATRNELNSMANDTNTAFAKIKQPLQAHHLTGDPELERVSEATLRQPVDQIDKPADKVDSTAEAALPEQTTGDVSADNAASKNTTVDGAASDAATPDTAQHSHDRHQ